MPTYKVGAKKDLPLDADRSWDGAAAQRRIWDWAGWDGSDAPDADGGKTAQAFLVYDADAADQKGAYHLPFADVVDGKLTALLSGCRAAASRLPQMDGLPSDVEKRARDVLDGYFAKADGKQDADDEDRASALEYRFPAAVVRQMPIAADGLPDVLKGRVMDPSVLDEGPPPFLFRSEISSGRLDSYGTRMHESTLRNFAQGASDGVSLQESHDTGFLPIGLSLAGKFTRGRGDSVHRTEADFAIFPDQHNGKLSSNDVIQGIRRGIYRDVSVGFYGGEIRCSLCGADMFSLAWLWDDDAAMCQHFPGIAYRADDGQMQQAEGVIHDAALSEVSLVYDGATPGAMVLKVHRMVEAGRLDPERVRLLEVRYRTKLPGTAHGWAGWNIPDLEARTMTKRTETPDPTEPQTEPKPETPPEPNTPAEPMVRMADVRAALGLGEADAFEPAAFGEQYRRLTAEAADGRTYRADLVRQALTEGARAFGEGFNAEMYERLLKAAPLEDIKRMAADWKAAGDKVFTGGRQSVDQADEAPNGAVKKAPPDFAFAG